jgi:hypothetical protein
MVYAYREQKVVGVFVRFSCAASVIKLQECTGVNGYCAKSGLSSSEWDTVKHQQGAVFNIPVCKSGAYKDAIFPLQAV